MLDLNTTLAFEVKKEIADRYFGFRKIIEEDTNAYQKNVIAEAMELEAKIGFDLVRLYVLLQDDSLINDLFRITGLGETLFYDPYISKSPTIRKRVLADFPVHGLTRKWRFQNMFFDIYNSLEKHVADYRNRILELAEDQETIKEEINLFYQKNDISGIMLFLRGMDGTTPGSSGPMAGALETDNAITMEQKMRIQPPGPVEKFLPVLSLIPPAKEIHNKLKGLVDRAFSQQPEFDPKKL
ncbi:MAG: hypothetical protein NTY00_03295 [Deltaproteobacteria bacterium]|nr:hypothetical protein [Deltaproteobacteria bacterium]